MKTEVDSVTYFVVPSLPLTREQTRVHVVHSTLHPAARRDLAMGLHSGPHFADGGVRQPSAYARRFVKIDQEVRRSSETERESGRGCATAFSRRPAIGT